ncbi:hypothetical protein BGT98_09705 [Clostridioides difficile]|nr:hypothetical protein BGT98_09705 [Clostridioides difficile]
MGLPHELVAMGAGQLDRSEGNANAGSAASQTLPHACNLTEATYAEWPGTSALTFLSFIPGRRDPMPECPIADSPSSASR